MPIKVIKHDRESSQSLVRRFSQKLRKSGILLEARKRRFVQKPKSQALKKRSALRRIRKKAEYIRLKKSGR